MGSGHLRLALEWGMAGTLLLCALSDLRHRRIPNRLVLSIAALALLQHLLSLPLAVLWQPLAAASLAAILLFPCWHFRLLGGGDLKLFVAAALWAGRRLPDLVLAVALAGGLLAVLWLAADLLQRRWLRWLAALPYLAPCVPSSLTEYSQKGASLPYGVAIAAGTIGLMLGAHAG
ncbi:hypothetical protein HRbin40_02650 [bacterium HR40]|nr:hypothetical protein HRbin40_02650 [bacterium HR40]